MEQPNKYISVAYELYTDNEKGIHELVEKAPAEHPFQFISGLGVALDAFESHIAALNEGDNFDFTLSVDEAYGPYIQEHVIELDKAVFCIDGKFDKNTIYPGNIVPLVNADGNRFQGLITDVKEDKVVVDLNHPLAGKALHFKGQVVTSREATNEEIKDLINRMSGEGCGGNCGGCEGGCHGEGHGDGECCGKHEGHHHDGECCGKHDGHHHGEGCCGGGHGHCH